jgi:hypothetical protein
MVHIRCIYLGFPNSTHFSHHQGEKKVQRQSDGLSSMDHLSSSIHSLVAHPAAHSLTNYVRTKKLYSISVSTTMVRYHISLSNWLKRIWFVNIAGCFLITVLVAHPSLALIPSTATVQRGERGQLSFLTSISLIPRLRWRLRTSLGWGVDESMYGVVVESRFSFLVVVDRVVTASFWCGCVFCSSGTTRIHRFP